MRKTGLSVSAETMDDFDLNLLRVLVALDTTRHVSKAALALDMSQSGFSTALSRLRQRFDDPLFVRTTEGMTPTPRAAKMIQTARDVLKHVQAGLLNPPEFDALTIQTEFRLVMADVAEVVFMPRLIPHLQRVAPRSRVTCIALQNAELASAMQAGDIDLALGYFPDLDSQAFFKQRLYTHTFGCLMRSGHPLGSSPLTLEDYCNAGHAVISSPSRSTQMFERHMAQRGLERRTVLSTSHHLSLPIIVADTDLIATIPLAAGQRFARHGTVKLVPLPFEPPSFLVQQHWHRLYHHDPRIRWLRQQVAELFNDKTDEWRDLESSLYGELRQRRQ